MLRKNKSGAVTYPGYDWLVTSTHDWRPPAPGPFVWVHYQHHGDGFATRSTGYAETRDAAHEAIGALTQALVAVDCPRCDKGTVIHRGSMWWQDQHKRCAWCQGTGRILVPAEEAQDG